MRSARHFVVLVALLGVAPLLSACADFDVDKLDVFGWGEKKPIPGDRKALFPEGVPGVTQGIPPQLMKGNQPPPETAELKPEEPKAAEVEKPKPLRKPKPRVARVRPSAPAQANVQPAAQGQAASSQANWPAPGQSQPAQTGTQAPWPSTAQQQPSAWPSSPAPGSFQR